MARFAQVRAGHMAPVICNLKATPAETRQVRQPYVRGTNGMAYCTGWIALPNRPRLGQ